MANEPKRPNELTVRPCNEIGLLIEKRCRLPEIRFYPEGQSVMFWAVVHDKDGNETEALQYLTPEAAMKFAKAMEACAIEALKRNTLNLCVEELGIVHDGTRHRAMADVALTHEVYKATQPPLV